MKVADAMKPVVFDNAPFELCGRPAGNGRCELWAVTPEGTVAMSAEVELA